MPRIAQVKDYFKKISVFVILFNDIKPLKYSLYFSILSHVILRLNFFEGETGVWIDSFFEIDTHFENSTVKILTFKNLYMIQVGNQSTFHQQWQCQCHLSVSSYSSL